MAATVDRERCEEFLDNTPLQAAHGGDDDDDESVVESSYESADESRPDDKNKPDSDDDEESESESSEDESSSSSSEDESDESSSSSSDDSTWDETYDWPAEPMGLLSMDTPCVRKAVEGNRIPAALICRLQATLLFDAPTKKLRKVYDDLFCRSLVIASRNADWKPDELSLECAEHDAAIEDALEEHANTGNFHPLRRVLTLLLIGHEDVHDTDALINMLREERREREPAQRV